VSGSRPIPGLHQTSKISASASSRRPELYGLCFKAKTLKSDQPQSQTFGLELGFTVEGQGPVQNIKANATRPKPRHTGLQIKVNILDSAEASLTSYDGKAEVKVGIGLLSLLIIGLLNSI